MPIKRPPGAPKGNTNALKHGFYSRRFRKGEIQDLELLLEPASSHILTDEIAMLRVTMRRTMDLAEGIEDIETAVRWLNVLGATATRIAALLRTQKFLRGAQTDSLDFLAQALDQITLEMGFRHPAKDQASRTPPPSPRKEAP